MHSNAIWRLAVKGNGRAFRWVASKIDPSVSLFSLSLSPPDSPTMNIQLELSFKQRVATRLGTCLFGLIAYIILKDNTKATLLLGAVWALMLRNPTFVFAMSQTIPRDIV